MSQLLRDKFDRDIRPQTIRWVGFRHFLMHYISETGRDELRLQLVTNNNSYISFHFMQMSMTSNVLEESQLLYLGYGAR